MLWRMLVRSPDFVTARETLTADDAVASLTDFSVDAAGSCLEASFTAVPTQVDIQPRDVITLQQFTGGAWQSFWMGYVTIAGNPRSDELEEYRAVGLKQRFYEYLVSNAMVDGADVATMAASVLSLSNVHLPPGASFASADAPLTGFELGDRFPQYESVGSFLAALADAVPAFIVPVGETYVYDGVTYEAGDTVPAVAWGINADGEAFFRRPPASEAVFTEGTNTRVTWNSVNAEDATSCVMFVYASAWEQPDRAMIRLDGDESTDPLDVAVPKPLALTTCENYLYGYRTVVLPNPIDYMTNDVDAYGGIDAIPSGSVQNIANAFDGDDATYAYWNNDDAQLWARAEYGSIVQVVVRGNTTALDGESVDDASMRILIETTSTTTVPDAVGDVTQLTYYVPLDASGANRTYWLPAMPSARVSSHLYSFVRIRGSVGTRVYHIRMYRPDTAVAIRFRDAYVRAVPSEVATLEYQGLSDVTFAATINLLDGNMVSGLRVERVSYRITVEDGVVTTYHVGQAFEPDLEAQRIVLERLARKANNGEPANDKRNAP